MRSVFRSFVIAFGTYSKIPMPHFEWKEEDMRYALCFFPFVGAVIGGLLWGFVWLAQRLGVGDICTCLVGSVIPLLVTGGIHLDGFMDVCDARHSYGDRERKLEILKDTHIGAFAVIQTFVCAAFYVGAVSELVNAKEGLTVRAEQGEWTALAVFCCGFILARTLSGLSLVFLRPARENGMLVAFAKAADRRVVQGILLLELGVTVGLMLGMGGRYGAMAVFAAILGFVYYAYMSKKEFGGITGDLAGFFVVVCESNMAVVLALGRFFEAVGM